MSPSISARLLLTQSDARLVELAREGHERAFEALVQRYRRPLLGYCRRLLLPAERAEDALQQGLLQAWLALQNGCEVRDPKPWLYRIVHNSALNALRSSGYDYATLNDTLRGADAPEQDLDRRIAVREALAGLSALPHMQREALMRTALDGHSHEQVARALGLSEGALRGLVYRARSALRAAATALTPSPMVSWALNPRTGASAPLLTRLAETGAGGGSLGIGGVLLKGGAVAVTAGALAGGIASVHTQRHHTAHPTDTHQSVLLAGAAGGPSAQLPSQAQTTAFAQVGGGRGADVRRATEHGGGPLAGQLSGGGLGAHRPLASLKDGNGAPSSSRDRAMGHDGQPLDTARSDGKGDRSGSGSSPDSSSRPSGGDANSGSGGGDKSAVSASTSSPTSGKDGSSKDGSQGGSGSTESSSSPSSGSDLKMSSGDGSQTGLEGSGSESWDGKDSRDLSGASSYGAPQAG